MSQRLQDVLSDDDMADLISQHDRYEWSGCDLQEVRRPTYPCRVWIVYYHGKAIQCYEDPPKQPVEYRGLAEAIEAADVFSMRVEDGEIKVPT